MLLSESFPTVMRGERCPVSTRPFLGNGLLWGVKIEEVRAAGPVPGSPFSPLGPSRPSLPGTAQVIAGHVFWASTEASAFEPAAVSTHTRRMGSDEDGSMVLNLRVEKGRGSNSGSSGFVSPSPPRLRCRTLCLGPQTPRRPSRLSALRHSQATGESRKRKAVELIQC